MSLVCLIAAIILFVLEAAGFASPVPLVPAGLAFFAAASLPWGGIVVNRPPPK